MCAGLFVCVAVEDAVRETVDEGVSVAVGRVRQVEGMARAMECHAWHMVCKQVPTARNLVG